MRNGCILLLIVSGLIVGADLRAAAVDDFRLLLQQIEKLQGKRFRSADEEMRLAQLVEEGERTHPTEPLFLYRSGDVRERRRHAQGAAEALDCWTRGLQGRSAFGPALEKEGHLRCAVRLGQIALSNDQLARAEALAQQAINIDPHSGRGYELLLEVSLRTGRLAGALQTIHAAIALPDPGLADRVRVSMHARQLVGDWTGFQSQFQQEQQLQRLPIEDRAWYAGLYERQIGHAVEAFAQFHLAHVHGPRKSPATMSAFGALSAWITSPDDRLGAELLPWVQVLRMHDRPALATEALQRCDDLRPKSPAQERSALLLRGMVLTTLELSQAQAHWTNYLKRWPDDPVGLCHLAFALESANEPLAAAMLLQQAHAFAPLQRDVWLVHRLGGLFRSHPEGVEVTTVTTGSALEQIGVKVGDRITAIDEVVAAKLSVAERLSNLRSFQGGHLTLRRGADDIRLRVEFLFLDD